jgi:hypothetical protein
VLKKDQLFDLFVKYGQFLNIQHLEKKAIIFAETLRIFQGGKSGSIRIYQDPLFPPCKFLSSLVGEE